MANVVENITSVKEMNAMLFKAILRTVQESSRNDNDGTLD